MKLTCTAHGIRNIFYFIIPCCAVCLFATVFCVKGQKTLKREDDERLKAEGKAWVKEHKHNSSKKGGKDKGKEDEKKDGAHQTIVELPPAMPVSSNTRKSALLAGGMLEKTRSLDQFA